MGHRARVLGSVLSPSHRPCGWTDETTVSQSMIVCRVWSAVGGRADCGVHGLQILVSRVPGTLYWWTVSHKIGLETSRRDCVSRRRGPDFLLWQVTASLRKQWYAVQDPAVEAVGLCGSEGAFYKINQWLRVVPGMVRPLAFVGYREAWLRIRSADS
jgi:hypothetical protein